MDNRPNSRDKAVFSNSSGVGVDRAQGYRLISRQISARKMEKIV